MRAIPTTEDPGKAEQTCPSVTRSFVELGAPPCHLGKAGSPVCGSTADGMEDTTDVFGPIAHGS
jgi:hypothetical protein